MSYKYKKLLISIVTGVTIFIALSNTTSLHKVENFLLSISSAILTHYEILRRMEESSSKEVSSLAQQQLLLEQVKTLQTRLAKLEDKSGLSNLAKEVGELRSNVFLLEERYRTANEIISTLSTLLREVEANTDQRLDIAERRIIALIAEDKRIVHLLELANITTFGKLIMQLSSLYDEIKNSRQVLVLPQSLYDSALNSPERLVDTIKIALDNSQSL